MVEYETIRLQLLLENNLLFEITPFFCIVLYRNIFVSVSLPLLLHILKHQLCDCATRDIFEYLVNNIKLVPISYILFLYNITGYRHSIAGRDTYVRVLINLKAINRRKIIYTI